MRYLGNFLFMQGPKSGKWLQICMLHICSSYRNGQNETLLLVGRDIYIKTRFIIWPAQKSTLTSCNGLPNGDTAIPILLGIETMSSWSFRPWFRGDHTSRDVTESWVRSCRLYPRDADTERGSSFSAGSKFCPLIAKTSAKCLYLAPFILTNQIKKWHPTAV